MVIREDHIRYYGINIKEENTMRKINWKTTLLGVTSFALMILTKVVDDKSRDAELAELKKDVIRDVTESLSNSVKES